MKKSSNSMKINNLNMPIESLHFKNFSNKIKINKIILLNLWKDKSNKFNIFKNYVNKKIFKFKIKPINELKLKILQLKDKLNSKLSLKILKNKILN